MAWPRSASGRDARAHRIARSLADAGIPGAYEGARRFVTSERLISRSHFARFLIEAGHAKDMKTVFRRYLTQGKPGHVAHAWATLPQAVGWIHAAGGQAVLAHPGRYQVTATGMRRLLAEFRDAGGDAIEVLSSSHTPAQFTEYATLRARLRSARLDRVRLPRPRRKLDGPGRPASAADGRHAGLGALVTGEAAT